MIVIYPMLTSGSISPNVLPGIVKAVEKYILLYNTDEVLRAAGSSSAGNILSTGNIATAVDVATTAAALLASKDNTDEAGSVISEAPMASTNKPATNKPGAKPASININIPKSQPASSGARPSLDIPRGDAISLEPTWISVTTKKKGMQILGVKVVPFTVKSGESMSQMITQDRDMKFLSYLATKYGRGITRVFFRLMRKIRLPIIKDKAISGDPKQDIIFGGTQYGQNMFVCLNQLDLQNDQIFSSPAGVQRLHKLGWASFVILDDVNRRATFCMKEFGGVCSVVPYGFMFSSLGKEHSKVYEDLEDLKKTSGPFFNMRTNRRRAFSESTTPPNVDKYLELLQRGRK